MKPDIFTHKPEPGNMPNWEREKFLSRVEVPFARFVRAYTDPTTGTEITEKKRVTSIDTRYERTEELPTGEVRCIKDHIPAKYDSLPEQSVRIIIDEQETQNNGPIKEIFYSPLQPEAPVHLKLDISNAGTYATESNFQLFYAMYNDKGEALQVQLSVSDNSNSESGFDFTERQTQQSYESTLKELAQLTALGINVAWPQDVEDKGAIHLLEVLKNNPDLQDISRKYIADFINTFPMLPPKEALTTAIQITKNAIKEYSIKNLTPNKREESIELDEHPYVHYLNYATGIVLSRYTDKVARASNFTAVFIPVAGKPDSFKMAIANEFDLSEVHSTIDLQDNKSTMYDGNIFKIQRENGRLLLQFQKLISPFPQNKDIHKIIVPERIDNFEQFIDTLITPDTAEWRNAINMAKIEFNRYKVTE